MAPIIGALATVVFVDTELGVLWVRFGNGNTGIVDPDDGPPVALGTVILVNDSSFMEAPAEVFPTEPNTGVLATVVLEEAD